MGAGVVARWSGEYLTSKPRGSRIEPMLGVCASSIVEDVSDALFEGTISDRYSAPSLVPGLWVTAACPVGQKLDAKHLT